MTEWNQNQRITAKIKGFHSFPIRCYWSNTENTIDFNESNWKGENWFFVIVTLYYCVPSDKLKVDKIIFKNKKCTLWQLGVFEDGAKDFWKQSTSTIGFITSYHDNIENP